MTPLSISPEPVSLHLDRRPRLALVGLGEAAHNIHVPACKLLRGADLVAGVDPSEGARDWLRSVVPHAEAFADVPAMLRAVRPDWMIVATPPQTHAPLCLEGLAAGANVLCEKPFVERSGDAQQILERERQTGRRVVVNHEFPHMRIFAHAIELARSARFGPVRFLQFWEHQWEEPGSLSGWRSQHLTLREFGTHVLDLSTRIYDARPIRVFAQMDPGGGPDGTDLVDVVTLTFPGGRLASIVLDRVCHGPHAYLEMRLDGRDSSMRASFGGEVAANLSLDIRRKRPSAWLSFCAGGQAWLERGQKKTLLVRESINPFAEATARRLAQAITDEASGVASGDDSSRALSVVQLVEATYESARTAMPVNL
jgi:predicted dehydrogenase